MSVLPGRHVCDAEGLNNDCQLKETHARDIRVVSVSFTQRLTEDCSLGDRQPLSSSE